MAISHLLRHGVCHLIGQAQVEHRVHHPRHGNGCAGTHRQQEWGGGVPELRTCQTRNTNAQQGSAST